MWRKNGAKIDEKFFRDRPNYAKALTMPKSSEQAKEIYKFIAEYSHYSVMRGIGMGADIAIAPDMIKLEYLAKKRGIEIFTFEEYCNRFVARETEKQQKMRNKDK